MGYYSLFVLISGIVGDHTYLHSFFFFHRGTLNHFASTNLRVATYPESIGIELISLKAGFLILFHRPPRNQALGIHLFQLLFHLPAHLHHLLV